MTPLLIYMHLKYECYFNAIYFSALLCLQTNFDLFVFARCMIISSLSLWKILFQMYYPHITVRICKCQDMKTSYIIMKNRQPYVMSQRNKNMPKEEKKCEIHLCYRLPSYIQALRALYFLPGSFSQCSS